MKKYSNQNLNQAVFTTTQIMKGNGCILYVFHFAEDGSWQFSGSEDPDNSNTMIVALHQIIDIDNNISELMDLQKGKMAFRNNENLEWTIANIK